MARKKVINSEIAPKFTNGKKINKVNVNMNWLKKVRNFIDIAFEDDKNGYWWIQKFPVTNFYDKRYGYDPKLYPGKTLLNRKVIKNEKTGRDNKIWVFYYSDYEIGYEFYNKFWKENYIKSITGIDLNKIILWINKLEIKEEEKQKKF